jgi:hypothetical protein
MYLYVSDYEYFGILISIYGFLYICVDMCVCVQAYVCVFLFNLLPPETSKAELPSLTDSSRLSSDQMAITAAPQVPQQSDTPGGPHTPLLPVHSITGLESCAAVRYVTNLRSSSLLHHIPTNVLKPLLSVQRHAFVTNGNSYDALPIAITHTHPQLSPTETLYHPTFKERLTFLIWPRFEVWSLIKC